MQLSTGRGRERDGETKREKGRVSIATLLPPTQQKKKRKRVTSPYPPRMGDNRVRANATAKYATQMGIAVSVISGSAAEEGAAALSPCCFAPAIWQGKEMNGDSTSRTKLLFFCPNVKKKHPAPLTTRKCRRRGSCMRQLQRQCTRTAGLKMSDEGGPWGLVLVETVVAKVKSSEIQDG